MQSILSKYDIKTHQEVYFKKDEKIPKLANWSYSKSSTLG